MAKLICIACEKCTRPLLAFEQQGEQFRIHTCRSVTTGHVATPQLRYAICPSCESETPFDAHLLAGAPLPWQLPLQTHMAL